MAHPLLPRVALGGAVLLGASALTLPALAAGGQDPSGDNGTIKVHADAAGDDTRNEPHVGCHFTVALFGFDADEHGTITFERQAPSGSGVLLSEHVLLSADAAGGAGQDPDEVYAFTAAQLGVSGSEQVHVKLTITADDAHGKDKHKVFWLGPCETAAAGESSSATATASESSTATATASASSSATATASESSSATATASESSSATATASESSSATATATASESSSATATASESTSATATATESTGGGVGGGTTGGGGTSGGGTAPGTVESGGTGSTGGGEVSGGVVGGVSGGVSGGGAAGAGNVGAGDVQAGGTQVLGEQYDTGTGAQGVLAHTGAAVGTVGVLGAALLAAGAYLRRRTTRSRLQD